MINLKVLSAAAVLALALPALAPTESFAQGGPQQRGHGAQPAGAPRAAGAGSPRFGGGGGPHFGGAGGPRVSGAGGPRFNAGGGGGHYAGGGGHRDGGGFIPGAIAGAVIGGAVAASQGPYYGNNGYYADSPDYAGTPYYNAPYDDGTAVVEAAPQGDDDVGYCMQTYRSYDPRSGTYLGFDGLRHPCP
jgi:hypothetical protein